MNIFFGLIFVFGAMIGSFLNVIIYRVPRDLNIVYPRSRCTQCNKLIPWYYNIPLLAYIFLRGKCAYCQAKIPYRYFLVELLGGLAAVYLFPQRLELLDLVSYFILFSAACVFICHFFIDLEHRLLPDVLNLYLGLVFLLNGVLFYSWTFWVLGILVGGGFPYLVSRGFYLYAKKEGLGLGDVKLFAVLGLYLGPQAIVSNILLSCTLGSVVGVGLLLSKRIARDYQIPFGPFIIIAASVQIFFPQFLEQIPFFTF